MHKTIRFQTLTITNIQIKSTEKYIFNIINIQQKGNRSKYSHSAGMFKQRMRIQHIIHHNLQLVSVKTGTHE